MMLETWPEMRLRHKVETYLLVRDALVRNGWVVARAARELGTAPAVLTRVVERHADLRDQLAEHGRGRGRPRSA